MSNSTGTIIDHCYQQYATPLPSLGLSQPAPSHRLHSGPTHAMHGKCLGCQMFLPSLTRTSPIQSMPKADLNQFCPDAAIVIERQQPGYRPASKLSTHNEFAKPSCDGFLGSKLASARIIKQTRQPSAARHLWWLQVKAVTCENFVQTPLNHGSPGTWKHVASPQYGTPSCLGLSHCSRKAFASVYPLNWLAIA